MKTKNHKTMHLGDLVAAVFDEAKHYSANPKEVSFLATQTVMQMLRQARRVSSILINPKEPTKTDAQVPYNITG